METDWRDYCDVCGRKLTPQERRNMDSDRDFYEHHGHYIGRSRYFQVVPA